MSVGKSIKVLSKLTIANTVGGVIFTANPSSTKYNLVLPAGQGPLNNLMISDGKGNLSWVLLPTMDKNPSLTTLTVSGASTLATLSASGLASLATLSTTGLATLASANITGATSLTTLSATGLATIANLFITGDHKSDTLSNTFVGTGAGNIKNGTGSVGFGAFALGAYNDSTALSYNSAGGYNSLFALTTGKNNTAWGYNSGAAITTGLRNTLLGSGADVTAATVADAIAIGQATVAPSATAVIGSSAVTELRNMGNGTCSLGNAANKWGSLHATAAKVYGSNLLYGAIITPVALTADIILTLPAVSGTVSTLLGVETLGNKIMDNTMLKYSTGTVSQSGNTITGSGTIFTPAMAGGRISYSTGASIYLMAYVSATVMLSDTSQTVASGTYTIKYAGLNFDTNGNLTIANFYQQGANWSSLSTLTTTTTYVVTSSDNIVLKTAGGNQTINLPDVTLSSGRYISFINHSTGVITFNYTIIGGKTNSNTLLATAINNIISDGTNWHSMV